MARYAYGYISDRNTTQTGKLVEGEQIESDPLTEYDHRKLYKKSQCPPGSTFFIDVLAKEEIRVLGIYLRRAQWITIFERYNDPNL